jgi:hypothetical protein
VPPRMPRPPGRGGRIPREWVRWSAGYAGIVTAGLLAGATALVVRDFCPPWTNLLLVIPFAGVMYAVHWLLALGLIGGLYGRMERPAPGRKHTPWNAATRRSVIRLLAVVPGAFAGGAFLEWRGMAGPWTAADAALGGGAVAAGWILGFLLLRRWDARRRGRRRP